MGIMGCMTAKAAKIKKDYITFTAHHHIPEYQCAPK